MVTKDDVTMILYQNIHASEITNAIENGTLLTYFGAIAEKIIEMNRSSFQSKTVKKEELKKPVVDNSHQGERLADMIRPTPANKSISELETVPEISKDSVRVRKNL